MKLRLVNCIGLTYQHKYTLPLQTTQQKLQYNPSDIQNQDCNKSVELRYVFVRFHFVLTLT